MRPVCGSLVGATSGNEAAAIISLRVNTKRTLPTRIYCCTLQYWPFGCVPIAMWPYAVARLTLLSSLAVVIPDSARAQPYRAAHITVWLERTLQSSISELSCSAPARTLREVRILTGASGRGVIANEASHAIPPLNPVRTRQARNDASAKN